MWTSQTRTILSLLLLVFLVSCSALKSNESPRKLKILGIFGHIGKSHFDMFKPLLEELAARGHDLTVISFFPRTDPPSNYRDISLRNSNSSMSVNLIDLQQIDDSYARIFKELKLLYDMLCYSCEIVVKHPQVRRLIESGEKFDVALTESFNTHCFMAIAHKLSASTILISTHQLMPWSIEDMGLSNEASYIPALLTRVPRPLSHFMDRVWNVATIAFSNAVYNTLFHRRDQLIARQMFGPDIPDVREFGRNATLMMVNTHYTLHGSVPYPPNVIEIGGIHIPKKTNPLPADLAKFLDEARNGVLYFNLGSMVKASTMPQEKLDVILKVFDAIPQRVVWKWETDNVPRSLNNVMAKKWLPQFDILGHPNVKCFFGHGGLLGLSEGVYHGIPMVLMPLFGDQYQNAMAAKARGAAVILRFSDLNEEGLMHALDEVCNNTKYLENARKLSTAYRDRPASPLETAVWWVEYVGRGNGLSYLRSEGASMSWCKRNLVDVATFFIAVALIIVYIVYLVVSRMRTDMYKMKKLSQKRD